MLTLNNVHEQFASLFKNKEFEPYAWLISKKLSEGHICVNLEDIQYETIQNFPYKNQSGVFLPDLKLLSSFKDLVSQDVTIKKPFILNNNLLYLQRYFAYETIILNRINKFIESEKLEIDTRKKQLVKHKKLLQNLFADQPSLENVPPDECVDWQLAAAITAIINNFTIITGGPGTGKTTTVAKILAILYSIEPNLNVALAAPTGKAAMRMAESLRNTNLKVSNEIKAKFDALTPLTIHRLLKYVQDSIYFKHNAEDPLNYDLVIIDESSMIDVALFAKLLDAIGPKTRIILLGDRNQLASVEAGSLFGDLCETQTKENIFISENANFINSFIKDKARQLTSNYIFPNLSHTLSHHIIELKRSHRFKGHEGIGKFSKAVITNLPTELNSFFDNKDIQVNVDENYNDKIFQEFVIGYKEYINEPDIALALKKINQLRVLCAVRDGQQGLYAINKKIEKYLHSQNLIQPETEFYHNRPIIITSNNYNLGLFNGDVGIIRVENNQSKAWFEDSEKGIKSVLPGYIDKSETVFAMTIHKSQGSEYYNVLVVLPDNENNSLLTRELLYTAVTRAKTKVTIQAKTQLILKTAEAKVKRASGIAERFTK